MHTCNYVHIHQDRCVTNNSYPPGHGGCLACILLLWRGGDHRNLTLMGKGSKRLFAHPWNGSHLLSVPCREQPLTNPGPSQHWAGTVTGTSLWAGQGLWCPRATPVAAKSGFISVLSTAKSFPLVMNFHASFILFPVTASLYQILFIIPPLLFNPADNHFLLEQDWFWVNILKIRFLYSIRTQTHTLTRLHYSHSHVLTQNR